MDISLNQTDDTCRCCLKNGHLLSLFDETIFEELEIYKAVTQIVPINVNKNDGYSQNICMDCKKQVEEFYNFRQMCISSDEFLRSNRRPISRNNEHDYSTLIDEYDMDLSEYLIGPSTLKDDTVELETEVIENDHPAIPVLDETQLNFNAPLSKQVKRKGYACPICSKLWITPSKLKRHMSSHKLIEKTAASNTSPQQQCPICFIVLESSVKLTQHMTTHMKNTSNSGEPNKEAQNFQTVDKINCTICGLECSTLLKLQTHMKAQHLRHMSIISNGNTHNELPDKILTNFEMRKPELSEIDLVCYKCGKKFATGIKLRRHLKTHIKTDKKPPPRPARPRRHECIHCGKKFETPSKLLRHMSVHRDLTKSTTPFESALEISTVTSILGD